MLAEAVVSGCEVAAIGISNQRETTLLWERESGRPLANAIVWQDRRTAPHCERLRGGRARRQRLDSGSDSETARRSRL